MLHYALIFFIIALVAAALGIRGVAGLSTVRATCRCHRRYTTPAPGWQAGYPRFVHALKGVGMPIASECGGVPITTVIALALAPGVSLTLVQSERGYCFSAWSRDDGQLMPEVLDEHKGRPFPTAEDAAQFYLELLSGVT